MIQLLHSPLLDFTLKQMPVSYLGGLAMLIVFLVVLIFTKEKGVKEKMKKYP